MNAPRFFGKTIAAALIAVLAPLFVLQPAVAAHDRVRYDLANDLTSLNPLLLNQGDSVLITELLFEPLLRLGPDFRFVPALATQEPSTRNGGISADGKRITFHLRPGTVWSDGTPVTASDVRFSIEQTLNPKNDIPTRAGFDRIATTHVKDAQTIEIDLKRADPGALITIEQTIPLPQHLLGATSDLNRAAYNSMPIGNGPYRVTEWKRGDFIRLAANSRYWRGKPHIPIIDLRIAPSVNTEMLLWRTHDIDLMLVPGTFAEQLPTTGVVRAVVPSLAWGQIDFNLANPILIDPHVRHALMLATDREKLAEDVGHGLYRTDRLMLPMFQWALDPTATPPPFDPQAASRLLDDDGWRVGADGLRHKGNRKLTLTMVFVAGGTGVLPATVAAEFERIHVAVEQKPVEGNLLWDTAAAGGILATGKFDLALIARETDPDPDMSWLFACDERAPAGHNFSHYCNADVDADLAKATSTFDRARRTRYLRQVQHALLRDAAFDPLFRYDFLWAAAPWLRGIKPSAFDPFWNVYDWTVTDP